MDVEGLRAYGLRRERGHFVEYFQLHIINTSINQCLIKRTGSATV
jgi:hypothetical protein